MALQTERLSLAELETLLAGVNSARVGIIGDICLDMYWMADMTKSALSRETPHFPLPVVQERYAPGGAGNVACNIAALEPGTLVAIGLVGDDWRGELLIRALRERGIDTAHILRDAAVTTNAYIKPMRMGISDVVYEDPRLDFENRAPLSAKSEARLISALESAAGQLDVLCVSDQMEHGCITPAVRSRLCELGAQGKTIIVDSRERIAEYRNVIAKPNEVEAARAFGAGGEMELARRIAARNRNLAVVTLGERGCAVSDGETSVHCPACDVEPPIDFCGAGDTFLAGFACLLAAGATPVRAAQVATLCSAVTIQKLGTTGTASAAEIVAAWKKYAK